MVVKYPPETDDDYNRRRRVGGYYQSLEEIEVAADQLDFDVVVPPRCEHGYFMCPAREEDLPQNS